MINFEKFAWRLMINFDEAVADIKRLPNYFIWSEKTQLAAIGMARQDFRSAFAWEAAREFEDF